MRWKFCTLIWKPKIFWFMKMGIPSWQISALYKRNMEKPIANNSKEPSFIVLRKWSGKKLITGRLIYGLWGCLFLNYWLGKHLLALIWSDQNIFKLLVRKFLKIKNYYQPTFQKKDKIWSGNFLSGILKKDSVIKTTVKLSHIPSSHQ